MLGTPNHDPYGKTDIHISAGCFIPDCYKYVLKYFYSENTFHIWLTTNKHTEKSY